MNEKLKVLFLDADGVINSKNTPADKNGFMIDPMMAFRVGKIQLDTDCEIVLSSSWRHFKGGREEIEKRVGKILDVTPSLSDPEKQFRGDEIEVWLNNHPEVEKYAILDDETDILLTQLPNFFMTSWEVGITDEIMNDVIKHFS